MFWGWFKSKVASTATLDKFRIKVITLKDGTKKYFPQYKSSDLSSDWLLILSLKHGSNLFYYADDFELLTIDNYEMSEENALKVIEQTKIELAIKRAKEYLSEEIIKIT